MMYQPLSLFYWVSPTQMLSKVVDVLSWPLGITESPKNDADGLLAQPESDKQFDCPYDYIVDVYGPHHFRKLIAALNPTLQQKDPALHLIILDLMDAIHFGAILVDDVADASPLRKGKIAAHRIFGSFETINRAYLRILEHIERLRSVKPELVGFVLSCLVEIHQGQDDSMVWRRDGFPACEGGVEAALSMYKHSATLKTGVLFKLIGQLVTGGHELDQDLCEFGLYCQIQNDCKNVFSSDVIKAKGALAEDLSNGEYSFPVIVALYASGRVQERVSAAMRKGPGSERATQSEIHVAALMLQEPVVRSRCLNELEGMRLRNERWAALWGRDETMSAKRAKSALDSGVDIVRVAK